MTFNLDFNPADPEMDDETQIVRFLIEDAFPWVTQSDSEKIEDHAEWKELRKHLPLLPAADLLWYLPFVLINLLLTHTNDEVLTEGAEYVVMQLNTSRSYSGNYYQKISEIFGENSAKQSSEENKTVYRITCDDYKMFNHQQAFAIYKWLMLAQTWNDFSLFSSDLESAIQYWHQKSTRSD